jgi:hypothetical protein
MMAVALLACGGAPATRAPSATPAASAVEVRFLERASGDAPWQPIGDTARVAAALAERASRPFADMDDLRARLTRRGVPVGSLAPL